MKLNLGCGANKAPGYLNVDIIGEPDYKWNLERIPWPFANDDSVDEVIAHHVLEHLGRDSLVYFGVVKELYRVCKNHAIIHITFPHHRHDNAVDDPSHVRQLTVYGFELFDKERNRRTRAGHHADSTLGLDLDVDFVVTNVCYVLEKDITEKLNNGELTEGQIDDMVKRHNNVIKEVGLDWMARKGVA